MANFQKVFERLKELELTDQELLRSPQSTHDEEESEHIGTFVVLQESSDGVLNALQNDKDLKQQALTSSSNKNL